MEEIVNARKLTVEEVAEIKALNQYDIQLYRYAVKLFFQRFSESWSPAITQQSFYVGSFGPCCFNKNQLWQSLDFVS